MGRRRGHLPYAVLRDRFCAHDKRGRADVAPLITDTARRGYGVDRVGFAAAGTSSAARWPVGGCPLCGDEDLTCCLSGHPRQGAFDCGGTRWEGGRLNQRPRLCGHNGICGSSGVDIDTHDVVVSFGDDSHRNTPFGSGSTTGTDLKA
ncbi:MAG: hypothetical protein JWO49_2756 [Arthrobacter sp.]|nr:hypothetical protein [Arthrobacter sp.]